MLVLFRQRICICLCEAWYIWGMIFLVHLDEKKPEHFSVKANDGSCCNILVVYNITRTWREPIVRFCDNRNAEYATVFGE
jgi:hypothetical protein